MTSFALKFRTFHRWIGLFMAVWILAAAFTGIMRANATYLYWKARPSREKPVMISQPELGMKELYSILEQQTGVKEVKLKGLELTPLLGRAVYKAEVPQGQASAYVLVDAATGEVLSPLTPEKARRIAASFVPAGTRVTDSGFAGMHRARKAASARPAYRVRFADSLGTEIFVDRDTGEVLTLLDHGRRFGLWMIRLHELDFAGLHRPALTAVGLGTIFVVLTGLMLAVRTSAAGRRRRPL